MVSTSAAQYTSYQAAGNASIDLVWALETNLDDVRNFVPGTSCY